MPQNEAGSARLQAWPRALGNYALIVFDGCGLARRAMVLNSRCQARLPA